MSFEWSTLAAPVARGLAIAAGLDHRDAAASLTNRFGSTPSEAFIDEMWPAMRDEWLQRDRPAAKALAERLRARGAGKDDVPIRNHDQRMAYLRGCRISKAVREEALAIFLTAAENTDTPNVRPVRAAPPPKAATRKVNEPTTDDKAVDVATLLVEAMRPGLAAMTLDHVPGLITALSAFISGNAKASKNAEELVPELFLATLHVIAEHQTIVPKGLDKDAVRDLGMPAPVATAAASVAAGCRSWAQRGPNDLGYLILKHFTTMVAERQKVNVDVSLGMLLHFLNTGGDPKVTSDFVGLKALAEWSVALMSSQRPTAAAGPTTPSAAPSASPERLTDLHPVVAEALRSAGRDERIHATHRGGMWFASAVGPTTVWSGDEVRSRDHDVTPVMVDTAFAPTRVPALRQLAAALSHANIHNGINSVAWLDGKVHLRTAMAAYPAVNGWLGPYLGVAMMSSAMFSLHSAPELRGDPVAGPDGIRSRPSWFVEKLEGFEVAETDANEYRLPTSDRLFAAASALLNDIGRVERDKSTIECRLPGPNGKLEGWLGRRGGKSDDQFLTISAVTRPPWGAGIKFVLRIPTRVSAEANEEIALRWNASEWAQVPSVNVWGGWSGEDGHLRLTSFVPQMLFRSSEQSNEITIKNFIVYAIGRGSTASVSLSLT